MKKLHIAKTVCAVGLATACVWSLAACSTGQAGSDGKTGGVAATVNGTEIYEDDVTAYIENVIRAQMGATDEDSWGQWLAQSEYTPESVREEVINSFVNRELITKEVEARGITVEASEVDSYVQQTKDRYEDDEKWQAALDQAGMTEEKYRAELEMQMKEAKLKESFAPTEDPSEADMLQYAQMYASTYDGARKSSHILFDANDEAKAQEILDQINAGELDFAQAAKDNSLDGSAQNGGDVGWDSENNFVEQYTAALDELQKDQVSGLVTSDYGIHIIKCTDVYTAPKTTNEDGEEVVEVTSVDQIPAEWAETIKELLNNQKMSEAYQQWIEEANENADIAINPMPQGLPYIVDMTKYVNKDAEGEGTSEGTGEGTGESTGEGESTDPTAEAPADGGAEQPAEGDQGADAGAEQPTEGGEAPADGAADQPADQPAEQ